MPQIDLKSLLAQRLTSGADVIVARPQTTYVPDFPSQATHVFRLDRDIAEAATAARGRKRRMRGWAQVRDDMFTFNLDDGRYLCVHDCKSGWVIDRAVRGAPSDAKVLNYIWGQPPVLFPDARSAMLFAQGCHPEPPECIAGFFTWG